MTEPGFLERLVGVYKLMGMTVTVAPKGERALQVSLPGQPTHELVPQAGTTFRLKGLSSFAIEFRTDPAGTATEAIVTTSDGVYAAPKRA